MKVVTTLIIFLILTEVAYRIADARWRMRAKKLEPASKYPWLVALGMVQVEYPPSRMVFFTTGGISWLAFMLFV